MAWLFVVKTCMFFNPDEKKVQFYIFVFIASLLIILHDFIQLTEFTVTWYVTFFRKEYNEIIVLLC